MISMQAMHSASHLQTFSHSCWIELSPLCNASNGRLTAQTTPLKRKSIYSALACSMTWNPFLKIKRSPPKDIMNLALICCEWETGIYLRYTLGDCNCLQQIHDRECLISVPCYLEVAFTRLIPF